MGESYKIVIKGPNVSVDQEVSEEQAKRFLVALFSGKAAEALPQQNKDKKDGGIDPAMDDLDGDSLATYITSSNAKSGPEKITAIGSFLKKHRATATFDKPTLEQGFSDAAEAVPKNMPRDIKMAIKSGWIAVKPGQQGTYYVTGGGQQAVTARFNDNPRRRAAKARNRKPKKGSV
jgi:hypothetical protein